MINLQETKILRYIFWYIQSTTIIIL